MGLLDQVLGQVIGRMGSGGVPSGAGSSGGGFPTGQPGSVGGLGGQLGGLLNGRGGPLAMAILALLASKNMSSGAGGFGSILHDMFGGGNAGAEPRDTGATVPSGSGPGGFMNEVGGMLGGNAGSAPSSGSAGAGSTGGLGGMLGGGALAGGLGELLNRFQQNGGGDVMNSWIGSGQNRQVEPGELEQHLGSGTVDDLSRQTGMDRGDLLSQLSKALPQVIDGLTPHGRLPTQDEGSRWI